MLAYDAGDGPETKEAEPVPPSVKLVGTTTFAEAVPLFLTAMVTVMVPP
jgi:hypothetical protein